MLIACRTKRWRKAKRAFTAETYQRGLEGLLAFAGRRRGAVRVDGFRCDVKVKSSPRACPWPRSEATDRLCEHWIKAGRFELSVNAGRGGEALTIRSGMSLPRSMVSARGAMAIFSEHGADSSKLPGISSRSAALLPKAALNAW